ncbi:MAG: hypothetical protein ACK55Z_01855, partial [bacterium]
MSAVMIVLSALITVLSAVISALPPSVAASQSRPISSRFFSRLLLQDAPYASAISSAACSQEMLAIEFSDNEPRRSVRHDRHGIPLSRQRVRRRAINRFGTARIDNNRIRAAVDPLENVDAARNQSGRRQCHRNRATCGIGNDQIIAAHHIAGSRDTPIRSASRPATLK